jgi:hypothetical protein
MCRVLEVSTSGFYDWLERPASLRQENNLRILGKIRYFHDQIKGVRALLAKSKSWKRALLRLNVQVQHTKASYES